MEKVSEDSGESGVLSSRGVDLYKNVRGCCKSYEHSNQLAMEG